MDPEARAKAPILEVGSPGEAGYLRLIESEVVARYLEDAFPRPCMLPSDPARKAVGHMFVVAFMEILVSHYNMCLAAKSQEKVDSAMVGIRRGLFSIDKGLEKYGKGEGRFFESNELGLVEALTGPFVVRMLANLQQHRGVDILSMEDVPHAVTWMKAVCNHPAIVNTTPATKSLCAIPPYLEPFFRAECSFESRMAKPMSSAASEASFAETIDAGLIHKGKAPRERSDTTGLGATSKL